MIENVLTPQNKLIITRTLRNGWNCYLRSSLWVLSLYPAVNSKVFSSTSREVRTKKTGHAKMSSWPTIWRVPLSLRQVLVLIKIPEPPAADGLLKFPSPQLFVKLFLSVVSRNIKYYWYVIIAKEQQSLLFYAVGP